MYEMDGLKKPPSESRQSDSVQRVSTLELLRHWALYRPSYNSCHWWAYLWPSSSLRL